MKAQAVDNPDSLDLALNCALISMEAFALRGKIRTEPASRTDSAAQPNVRL